jgi:hypothetical protein
LPATALQHFKEDIARAKAVVAHAGALPRGNDAEQLLRSDLLRAGWIYAVAALDAYFCDAYTDLIAGTISSKSRQPTIVLPERFYEIEVSIRAVLDEYESPNWRWRIAARKMMERENVLSLATIQALFNKFFREDQQLFGSVLDTWMSRPEAKIRLFGVTNLTYTAMTPPNKGKARKHALERLEERFATIFQRYHDCIHNCDRPKFAPQPLDEAGTVLHVIQDVEFLVLRCDEHINTEFRQFLEGMGCTPLTAGMAGY